MSRNYLREVLAFMLVSLACGAPQHPQVLQQSNPVQMSPAEAAHFMQQQNALSSARNLVDHRNQLPLAIRLTNGIGDALQATELQLGGHPFPWRNVNPQASPVRSPQNGQAILSQPAPAQPSLAAPFQVPALPPIQSAPIQVPTDALSRTPQVFAPATQAASALAPRPVPNQRPTFTPAPAPQNALVRPIAPVNVPAFALFPSAPSPAKTYNVPSAHTLMQSQANTVATSMSEPLFMALNQGIGTESTPSANSPFFVVVAPVNSPESSPQLPLSPTNSNLASPSPQAMFVQVPSGETSVSASPSPQNTPTNTLSSTSSSNADFPFFVIVPTGDSPLEAPIMMPL